MPMKVMWPKSGKALELLLRAQPHGWARKSRYYRTYGSLAVLLRKLKVGLGGSAPMLPWSKVANSKPDMGVIMLAQRVIMDLDRRYKGKPIKGPHKLLAKKLRKSVRDSMN